MISLTENLVDNKKQATALTPCALPVVDFGDAGALEYVAFSHGRISARGEGLAVCGAPNGLFVRDGRPNGGNAGGGKRGVIDGFSRASARNLRRVLMCTPLGRYMAAGKRAKESRGFFLSLTYPADYPDYWQVWKSHRRAFAMRLKREFPDCRQLWKLEFQDRGAPHFHVLLLLPAAVQSAYMRKWSAAAWRDVVGSSDKWHGVYGADARAMYGKDGRAIMSYVLKYLGKTWAAGTNRPKGGTGRVWGHSQDWPQELIGAVYLVGADQVEFLRRLRRWGRRSRYLSSRYIGRSFDVLGNGRLLAQLLRGLSCIGADGTVFSPP